MAIDFVILPALFVGAIAIFFMVLLSIYGDNKKTHVAAGLFSLISALICVLSYIENPSFINVLTWIAVFWSISLIFFWPFTLVINCLGRQRNVNAPNKGMQSDQPTAGR